MANHLIHPTVLEAPAMTFRDTVGKPESAKSDEAWVLRQYASEILLTAEGQGRVPGSSTISDGLLETVHTNHQRAVDASVAAIKGQPQEAE